MAVQSMTAVSRKERCNCFAGDSLNMLKCNHEAWCSLLWFECFKGSVVEVYFLLRLVSDLGLSRVL